jgi:hypothetical protein
MNIQVRSPITTTEQRLPFERVALVLQGDGALGAYQTGVHEFRESGIHPNWRARCPQDACWPCAEARARPALSSERRAEQLCGLERPLPP